MRVPVPSSPQSNPKPSNLVRTIALPFHTSPNLYNNNPPTSPCYEPNSVPNLCRSPSPSPSSKPTDSSIITNSQVEPVMTEHALHNLDWDSIMNDLGGLQDDTTNNPSHLPLPTSELTPFDDHTAESTTLPDTYFSNNQNPNHNYNINGFDFIEDLIRAADCFDNNQLQLAQVILDRLNQRLPSPIGKPLQRAAFYFKEALQSLLSGSNRTPKLSSLVEIVHGIRTFKAFSGISPIPMFSIFTTNQALLEAFHGSSFMHVIDFDIGLGIQYASLMKEIAEKVEFSSLLRITAVVPEEYALESTLVQENLTQFAHGLGIRVQVDFLLLRTFETLSFKAVRFVDGEKTAVLLSPAIFHRLVSAANTAAFLEDVRSVLPSVVVFVDGEGWAEATATSSFRRGVVSSLEFYAMMLESLDASVVGGGGEWVGKIEMLHLRPKILAAVEGCGQRMSPWREAFYGAGMRPVQLSQFADFQAECLLAKSQIRGFQVAKRQAELVLFWNERAMVATSAWRC